MVTLPCSRGRHERCGYELHKYQAAEPTDRPILTGVRHCTCSCHDLGLFGAVE